MTSISADALWRFLSQLGLGGEEGGGPGGQPHPTLGRLDQLMRRLEARRYIVVVDTKQTGAWAGGRVCISWWLCVLAKRCVPGGEARRYIVVVDTKQTGAWAGGCVYQLVGAVCVLAKRCVWGVEVAGGKGVHCGGGHSANKSAGGWMCVLARAGRVTGVVLFCAGATVDCGG